MMREYRGLTNDSCETKKVSHCNKQKNQDYDNQHIFELMYLITKCSEFLGELSQVKAFFYIRVFPN